MSRAARAGGILATLGAAAIAVLTLTPQPGAAAAAAATPLYCVVCGQHGGADVVRNVLLFIPVGLGIGLATGSIRVAAGVAAAGSLSVELLQLTVVPGRDASLSDLLTNTTGGWAGALIASRLRLLALPRPRTAWSLLLGGCATGLGLLALSAWALTPYVGERDLSSTWATDTAQEAFLGRVVSVSADGRVMPASGSPLDVEALRQSLEEGQIALEVQVVTGPWAADRRWIYVLGEPTRPTLFLSRHGRSAVLGVPTRALALRLHPPTVVLRRAFPRDSGASVRLRAGERDRTLWLASRHAGGAQAVSLALSPAHGWMLILANVLGYAPGVRLTTALLVGASALLLGYWGAATHRESTAALILVAAALAGLGLLPLLTGFQPVHWSEWAAAAGGGATGWALCRVAAYLQLRCGSPSASVSSSS